MLQKSRKVKPLEKLSPTINYCKTNSYQSYNPYNTANSFNVLAWYIYASLNMYWWTLELKMYVMSADALTSTSELHPSLFGVQNYQYEVIESSCVLFHCHRTLRLATTLLLLLIIVMIKPSLFKVSYGFWHKKSHFLYKRHFCHSGFEFRFSRLRRKSQIQFRVWLCSVYAVNFTCLSPPFLSLLPLGSFLLSQGGELN